jgi:hypothetical protein
LPQAVQKQECTEARQQQRISASAVCHEIRIMKPEFRNAAGPTD